MLTNVRARGRVDRSAAGSWVLNVSRRVRQALGVVLLSSGLAGAAAQQVEPDCDPELEGWWDGIYRLQSQINPDELEDFPFREIAHAVVLPPPNAGWVLVWCARYCDDYVPDPLYHFGHNRTWLLNQADPGTLIEITVPDPPAPFEPGSADLFCGGQTISHDGRVIVAGGTDTAYWCANSTLNAHDRLWVFDNVKIDQTTNPAILPAWHLQSTDMADTRWYAGVHRLSRKPGESVDSILVTGNSAPPLSSPGQIYTRQYGHVDSTSGTFVWDSSTLFNWRYAVSAPPSECDHVSGVIVQAYAHLHQLLDGRVQCVVTETHGLMTPPEPTLYLDRLACPTDGSDKERWIVDATQPTGLGPNPEGAPSVQLIDASSSPARVWIYSIGGGHGETGCPSMATQISDQVLVMEDPNEFKDWSVAPSLHYPRNSSNAVVGLDGSIIVNGGVGYCEDGCPAQKRAERYRPPGIFAQPDTAWAVMCIQTAQRAYHSWTVTQADGTLLSGGGEGLCPDACLGGCVPPPAPSNHTVEVYKPPYMYLGARPQIVAVQSVDGWDNVPVLQHGDTLTIEAAVPGTTGGEFRVALISPSAVTHALNTNQRYVKVAFDPGWQPALNPFPATTTIDVVVPPDADIVPTGYYMVAITASNGSTSTAKWVKIEYAP
jgi:hypothetical protein